MSRETCLEKIKKLPLAPGVYIMKDRDGNIIYVGKAKKLKNRVGQYFVGNHLPKVEQMVRRVDDFDYIVAPSETEALILENNLIKLHRPKYNILLKDDKTYPYLALDKNAGWPRLTLCRRREKDGKVYFGPFASGGTVRDIKRQTEQLFGLVTCVPKRGTRPCLSYRIGQCCGPCTGRVSREEYDERVAQALSFLKGDYKKTLREMRSQMERHAEALEFEQAAALRDRIRSIERLGEGQIIDVAPDIEQDVFGLAAAEDRICISVMTVSDGKVRRQERFFPDGAEERVLQSFIERYYSDMEHIPPRVVLRESGEIEPVLWDWLTEKRGTKTGGVFPKRGVHLKLLEMAEKNAAEGLEMRLSLQKKAHRLSVGLSEFLGLEKPVGRIEMYDISHFGEDAMVGGMVVWQNGGLKKSLYRRFNIRQGFIDDYGATREVFRRRLERYKNGETGFAEAPDVILTDGGRGHLSAVEEIVREYLPDCALFGLVKDGRHRTRALVTPSGEEIGLAGVPRWFSFFTMLQDEAHRYAITTMQNKKSKMMTRSGLFDVPGLGEKRARVIMDHFKTMEALRGADLEALRALPGIPENAAAALYEYLHGERK